MQDTFGIGPIKVKAKIGQMRAKVKRGWGVLTRDTTAVRSAEDALTVSLAQEWRALPQAERDARLACLLNTL